MTGFRNVAPGTVAKRVEILKEAIPQISRAAFIMNPTKKDPAYPPMPNPGLTPAQASAVADYELSHYKEATGGAAGGAAPVAADSTKAETGGHK